MTTVAPASATSLTAVQDLWCGDAADAFARLVAIHELVLLLSDTSIDERPR
jgi:hypothetical protein